MGIVFIATREPNPWDKIKEKREREEREKEEREKEEREKEGRADTLFHQDENDVAVPIEDHAS